MKNYLTKNTINDVIKNINFNSVKMRDARKYGLILGGIALIIKTGDEFVCHVLDRGGEANLQIGNLVKIDVHSPDNKDQSEVIDVIPKS